MCPFCLATTMGFIVAGAVSTGGLAALAFKLSRKKERSTRHRDNHEHSRLPRLRAQGSRSGWLGLHDVTGTDTKIASREMATSPTPICRTGLRTLSPPSSVCAPFDPAHGLALQE